VRSENFLLVAITAERFASRPSRLVGLDDPVLALDFDLAAAARLLERERESLESGAGTDDGYAIDRGGSARSKEAPLAHVETW
jgi:hypothetical protein